MADTLEADLARCMAQNSWLTRVQCYDRTAHEYGIRPVRDPVSPIAGVVDQDQTSDAGSVASPSDLAGGEGLQSQWQIASEASSRPGVENVWLTTFSENSQPGPDGDLVSAEFDLRCLEGSLDAMLSAGSVKFNSPQSMALSLPPGPEQTLDWSVSADNEWAFHPSPHSMIEQLLQSPQLTITLRSAQGTEIYYDFLLFGLRDALPRLKAACPRT